MSEPITSDNIIQAIRGLKPFMDANNVPDEIMVMMPLPKLLEDIMIHFMDAKGVIESMDKRQLRRFKRKQRRMRCLDSKD